MIILPILSSLAFLIDLGIFIAFHVLPTGYNPIRHAVSDYAIGKYGFLFRIRLWVNALGILVLTAALTIITNSGKVPLAPRDLIFLALVALIRIAMAFAPTNLEGQKLTLVGLLHYLFAILSFAFAYTALHNMTPIVQQAYPWAAGILGVLNLLLLPALVAVVVTLVPALRRIFGLFERIYLLTILLWLLTVSIALVIG